MRNFVIAWFVLAVVVALLAQQTSGYGFAQLPGAFWDLSVVQKLTVILILFLLFWLLGSAIWQADKLAEQEKALKVLQQRLDGVRQNVLATDEAQRELDSGVRAVLATDPEETVISLQKRLTDAERRTALQQGRNEAADMKEQIEGVQARQKSLRLQLGDVVAKRRTSLPVFDEIKQRQADIDRSLAEIEADDKGGTLGERAAAMQDHALKAQARFAAAQDALVTLVRLKDDLGRSQAALAPLEHADSGVTAVLGRAHGMHDDLVRRLDAMEPSTDETLAARVARLQQGKRDAEQRMATLDEGIVTVRTFAADIAGLHERQGKLDALLAAAETDEAGRSLDDRLKAASEFANRARGRIATLQDAQLRLAAVNDGLAKSETDFDPLRNPASGIPFLVGEIQTLQRRLAGALDLIESDGERTLGTQLEALHQNKRQTEFRVEALKKTFAELESMRGEIGALFTGLSNTLNGHAGPRE